MYNAGPKHLACVEFAGGQPQWKRRARARFPSDDPEHVTAICKAEYVDGEKAKEEQPGRSVSLSLSVCLCVSVGLSWVTHRLAGWLADWFVMNYFGLGRKGGDV